MVLWLIFKIMVFKSQKEDPHTWKTVMNLIGLLMNPVDSCHNNESCRFINESCRFINESCRFNDSSLNLINKVHVSYHMRNL